MRELTKSIGSFSWALSLFGMRQMVNVMDPDRVAEALDNVTEAAQVELGDVLRSTFALGDRMQRSVVDMTFGMVPQEMFDPRAWTRTMTDMTDSAARTVAGMAPNRAPGSRGRGDT